jgi:hypothetical protein
MIDFVVMPTDGESANWIEVVRVQVSHDLNSCHYSPTTRETTAAELEGLIKKSIRMKDENGQSITIAVVTMSDKVKANPEAIQRHIRNYIGHPIRYVVAREIQFLIAVH